MTSLPQPEWHESRCMEPGDVLVEECVEIDGMPVRMATSVKRDGVVVKRTIESTPIAD